MTASVSQAGQAQLDELERLYRVRLGNDLFGNPISRDDLIAFLDANPDTLPVLLDTPAHIAPFFPGSPLYLRLEYDPEISALDTITIYIVTALPFKDARKILRDFYHTWGQDACRKAHQRVFFGVAEPGDLGEE